MRADIGKVPADRDYLPVNPMTSDLNLLNSGILDKNAGYRDSQYILLRKYCALYPDRFS